MTNEVLQTGLIHIDVAELAKIVIVVSIEVVGIVQLLKNYLYQKPNHARIYPLLSVVFCALCAFLNTTMVSNAFTNFMNIFLLSLAVTQLAYEVIVNAIPNIANSFIESVFKINKKD